MRYLFIIFLLCSCSYEASNPVMPLRDYTLNTGKTFYIMGNASVEEIINVINKNYHSRGQYKVIPVDGGQELLKKIAEAITYFSWVDLDLKNVCSNVTSITTGLFKDKNIRTVILPDCINTIEEEAFANCKQLNNIRFSNTNATTIHANAFANDTVLQTIILNANEIKDNAFVNASIVNLIIESTNKISNNAFQGTGIINLQYNGTNNIFNDMNIQCENLYLPKVTNLTLQPTWNNLKPIWTKNIYSNKSL